MRFPKVGLALLALVAMALGAGCQSTVQPGQVGITVNYRDGVITEVAPGHTWTNTDPMLHTILYPTTQQTLVMVQQTKEGKVVGDDAIPCRDDKNNQVSWDVSLTWRVDPTHAKDLYLLKRELPLDLKDSDEDIASQVVRQSARSKLREVCPHFNYTTMEASRPEISAQYKTLLSAEMGASFLIVDEVYLRDLHMDKGLQDAINNFIAGNNALAQAEFQRQKADVDAKTATIQYEQEQRKQTYENDQTNLRKVNQAKADAIALLARMNSEAEGNERLAKSVTPALSDYVRAQHWDGKLPTTVLGKDTTQMVQVP